MTSNNNEDYVIILENRAEVKNKQEAGKFNCLFLIRINCSYTKIHHINENTVINVMLFSLN